MKKVVDFLKGKKTYFTALAMAVTALAAFSNGTIDGTSLVAALFAAIQSCFIRLGIPK